jgi:hypothetical protein
MTHAVGDVARRAAGARGGRTCPPGAPAPAAAEFRTLNTAGRRRGFRPVSGTEFRTVAPPAPTPAELCPTCAPNSAANARPAQNADFAPATRPTRP